MVSTRTLYRQKRIELIKECIMILTDMLTWEKKELEKIPLPLLKRIRKFLNRKNKKEGSNSLLNSGNTFTKSL